MNCIFDPHLLFISLDDWSDEVIRDKFLQQLIDNLEIIDNYTLAKILWCDELEARLWSSPQYPPWKNDIAWKNQIIPTIYRRFGRNTISICLSNNQGFSTPDLELLDDQIREYFFRLIDSTVSDFDSVILCLQWQRRKTQYVLTNFKKDKEVNPRLVIGSSDWFKIFDPCNYLWPTTLEQTNLFDKVLEITKDEIFPSKTFLTKCRYSAAFVEDILRTPIGTRKQVTRSIVKRLCMTKLEASKDNGLKEEYLEQTKEYRFRVTGASRIHYVLQDGSIEFLRLYLDGEHDEGLT